MGFHMKPTISVTEAVRNFADFINRVVYRREEFVLERGGKPVARLTPVPQAGRLGDLLEFLETIPGLSEADAEAFGLDLEEARDEVPPLPVEGPWDS